MTRVLYKILFHVHICVILSYIRYTYNTEIFVIFDLSGIPFKAKIANMVILSQRFTHLAQILQHNAQWKSYFSEWLC